MSKTAGCRIIHLALAIFAYNPGALVWAGGQVITSTGVVTASAHGLETAPMAAGGLQASLRYSGLPGSNTLRTLASFFNPTGGTVNTTITFVSNLYPGGSTSVRASSNGNNTFEAADRWVVMSDDPVNPYYAATGHVLYGPGPVALPASSVSQTVFECYGSTTGVLARYSLSVPPGATRRLMFFNQMGLTNEGSGAGGDRVRWAADARAAVRDQRHRARADPQLGDAQGDVPAGAAALRAGVSGRRASCGRRRRAGRS